MELKIDAEVINKLLVEMVANSEIGKSIALIAKEKLGNWDFKRSVEGAIERMVHEQARQLVEKDENIKAAIVAAVSREITPELIAKVVEAGTSRVGRF